LAFNVTAPKWNEQLAAETVITSPVETLTVTPLVNVGAVPFVQLEQNDDVSMASL
jgi:hypothetical protein